MDFSVALTGDAMITRRALFGADPGSTSLLELLTAADFAFTNLEVVATDLRGHHSSGALNPTLVASSDVLDELVGRFDVVSFANNHTMNLGIDGLRDTVSGLRTRGIACAGVGETLSEASLPAYVDGPGGSIGLVACATTFTAGDEATRPSHSMIGRPGLNPLRHIQRFGVDEQQFDQLADVHAMLGLDQERDYLRSMRFVPPEDGPDTQLFGHRFFVTDHPGRRTRCLPRDLDRICKWVTETKARSRVALVSIHSHESGAQLTEPAEFVIEFAHRVIEAGADAVIGHGPHRIRGIEVYEGKPIFYSLGNFVAQSELAMLSSHSYDVFGADDELTPHEVVGGSRVGFADSAEYWRSVVPVLQFGRDRLEAVRLYPISLGFDLPDHHRGWPTLAPPLVAEAVLADLRTRSATFGTTIGMQSGVPMLNLPSQSLSSSTKG